MTWVLFNFIKLITDRFEFKKIIDFYELFYFRSCGKLFVSGFYNKLKCFKSYRSIYKLSWLTYSGHGLPFGGIGKYIFRFLIIFWKANQFKQIVISLIGDSGMGNYHGKSSYETFSHQRSVLNRSFSAFSEKLGEARFVFINKKQIRYFLYFYIL